MDVLQVDVVEAATNFQKAEICLKRSDFTQAESLCKKAVEADPQQPEIEEPDRCAETDAPETHPDGG